MHTHMYTYAPVSDKIPQRRRCVRERERGMGLAVRISSLRISYTYMHTHMDREGR